MFRVNRSSGSIYFYSNLLMRTYDRDCAHHIQEGEDCNAEFILAIKYTFISIVIIGVCVRSTTSFRCAWYNWVFVKMCVKDCPCLCTPSEIWWFSQLGSPSNAPPPTANSPNSRKFEHFPKRRTRKLFETLIILTRGFIESSNFGSVDIIFIGIYQ